MPENVLLVFEKPWDTPKVDSRSASVLPFLEGLSRKLDFNIFYTTFYDYRGFDLALSNLVITGRRRQILYIGMHGHYDRQSTSEIKKMMKSVVKYGSMVEGVILGSCFFGANNSVLELAIKDGNAYGVHWIFGYRHAMQWINSTLLDIALLQSVMSQDNLLSEASALDAFTESLELFNMKYCIGQSKNAYEQGLNIYDEPLHNSIKLYYRGATGTKPKDLTKRLLARF